MGTCTCTSYVVPHFTAYKMRFVTLVCLLAICDAAPRHLLQGERLPLPPEDTGPPDVDFVPGVTPSIKDDVPGEFLAAATEASEGANLEGARGGVTEGVFGADAADRGPDLEGADAAEDPQTELFASPTSADTGPQLEGEEAKQVEELAGQSAEGDAGQTGEGDAGQSSEGDAGQSTEGGCDDTPPPYSQFSCEEQKNFGKCGEEFMKGFCQASCGTCGETLCIPDPPPGSGSSCEEQKNFGKCSADFMQGFCCGVC